MTLIPAAAATSFTPEEMDRFLLTEISFTLSPILFTAHHKRRERSEKLFPRLSHNIFEQICRYLSLHDLSSFMRCEREWTQAHSDTFKRIFESHKNLKLDERMVKLRYEGVGQIRLSPHCRYSQFLAAIKETPQKGEIIYSLDIISSRVDGLTLFTKFRSLFSRTPHLQTCHISKLGGFEEVLYVLKRFHLAPNCAFIIDQIELDSNDLTNLFHSEIATLESFSHIHIKDLHLVKKTNQSPDFHLSTLPNSLLKNTKRIELSTFTLTDKRLKRLLVKMPMLESLFLHHCHGLTSDLFDSYTENQFPRLKEIGLFLSCSISPSALSKLFKAMPHLEKCLLSDPISKSRLIDKIKPPLFSPLPHLQEFKWKGKIQNRLLKNLFRQAPHLRSLSLQPDHSKQNDNVLKYLAKNPLQSLESLELTWFNIEIQTLDAFCWTTPQLKKLKLYEDYLIGETWAPQKKSLRALEELYISSYEGQNPTKKKFKINLPQLMRRPTRLQKLVLNGTYNFFLELQNLKLDSRRLSFLIEIQIESTLSEWLNNLEVIYYFLENARNLKRFSFHIPNITQAPKEMTKKFNTILIELRKQYRTCDISLRYTPDLFPALPTDTSEQSDTDDLPA